MESKRDLPETGQGQGPVLSSGVGALLVVDSDAVPNRWQARSRAVSLVALSFPEVRQLGDRESCSLGEADEHLVKLLLGGDKVSTAATKVGVSTRTAQRRLAKLRRTFGARSTSELLLHFQRASTLTQGSHP